VGEKRKSKSSVKSPTITEEDYEIYIYGSGDFRGEKDIKNPHYLKGKAIPINYQQVQASSLEFGEVLGGGKRKTLSPPGEGVLFSKYI